MSMEKCYEKTMPGFQKLFSHKRNFSFNSIVPRTFRNALVHFLGWAAESRMDQQWLLPS